MLDRQAFFDRVRSSLFGGHLAQPQVDGCNAILDEWERRQLCDLHWLAYMLATVFWECDRTMQPIRESGGEAYLKSKPYYPWFGRGYVQLTWRSNYLKFRQRVLDQFRVDIIADADNALRPDVAAFIMFDGMINGEFTGHKLADYFHDGLCDFLHARRIINGMDRADTIAGFARTFDAALMASDATASRTS